MADISDVESALLSLLTQMAYPSGTSAPSAVLDSGGKPHNVQLYRGWPVPDQLDTDMAAGTVDVSIFPTRVETNVTRYGLDYEPLRPFPAPTLTLTATSSNGGSLELEGGGGLLREDGGNLLLEGSGITLTVGGRVSVPQNVAVI